RSGARRARSPTRSDDPLRAHFKCNQGSCSLRKKCFDGSNPLGSSNEPTWKCVSFGNCVVSQVRVEPQRAQNPRVVPGEDLNLVISPLVTVYAPRSKPTKTETGAPLCRRQLWQ